MKGFSLLLRRLVYYRPSIPGWSSSSLTETLTLSSAAAATVSYSTLTLADGIPKPLFNSLAAPAFSFNLPSTTPLINHSRSFSNSSSGPPNMVLIETEKQLNDSLRKAQDESLPAIFYFTAVWCGPCKLISPHIERLSTKYPHVATFKIDIDKEGLETALGKLNIHAVPTIHFFQNGKKASEVVGADLQKLSATMEELYK